MSRSLKSDDQMRILKLSVDWKSEEVAHQRTKLAHGLKNSSRSFILWLYEPGLTFIQNKPGTAQVGVISKAQKNSRNNYCETFQLSHSAEKYPKGFSVKLENSFFSELETSEKN